MKIAITGAGGFLGTELLRQLTTREDAEVYAFTFDFERERETFPVSANIINIDNREAAAFDYSEIDVLIHCAFPRNVNDASFADGLEFIQHTIEKAASDRVGAVIHISSQSVYSQARREAADENEPVVLESKYAVGKYWSELFVNTVCRQIRHTNLRMASLIGAGFNQRLTNKFAARVIAGEPISVIGGDQRFGFMDIRDAAAGIIRAALSEGEWETVYNLGAPYSYTLKEIAETAWNIGEAFGCKKLPLIVNEGGDWQNTSLNCSRFARRFDFTPQYRLEDTMRTIFSSLLGGE